MTRRITVFFYFVFRISSNRIDWPKTFPSGVQITNYKLQNRNFFDFGFVRYKTGWKRQNLAWILSILPCFVPDKTEIEKIPVFVICNLYSTRKGLRSIHTVGRNTKYKIEKHCNPPGHRLLWWRIRNTKWKILFYVILRAVGWQNLAPDSPIQNGATK